MKYRNIFLIVFLLVLSLLYTWYEASRPQPVDWTETYSPEDKIPYGTYITYRSLPWLFPQSAIETSRLPRIEKLDDLYDETGYAFIFIEKEFIPDPVEWRKCLEWVENGNQLFVAAEQFADTVLNTFSLSREFLSGKVQSKLCYGETPEQIYSFQDDYFSGFKIPEEFPGDILGRRIPQQHADFLRIPHGEGQIFLNLNPKGFTNFFVLDSISGDYYYRALSGLADNGGAVIWDAYNTLEANNTQTLMRVILRFPALRTALYLLLAGALLYVFFRARREQRPIPVVRLPENKMLEFAATVSALYYKKREHTSVALKHIDFFLEEVRIRFLLRTDVLDELFVKLLSERSGVEEKTTADLVQLIVKIKGGQQVTEKMLETLVKYIEHYQRIKDGSNF